MLRLPEFNYQTPDTIEAAVELLRVDPQDTRIVAGGTDLWPNMKRRHQSAETVVSLQRIEGLFGITADDAGGFEVGAMTTLADILEDENICQVYPGLGRAVQSVSSTPLRNTGTLGGNLCLDTRCTYYNQSEEWRRSIDYCMKERGETCWVAPGSSRCWAISSSDTAPFLCAIGARIRLQSTTGVREVRLADLYVDDGIDYLSKRRDEILTHIMLPAPGSARSTYWKLRRRGSIDFPVLGVACSVTLDEQGVVSGASIFLGAVASAPVAALEASDSLVGKALDDSTIDAAASLSKKLSTPLENTDFIASWRKTMVERYVAGALRELAGLEPRVKAPIGFTVQ